MAASTPVTPNWADLPDDALLTVFERLGSADVLLGVCRSWLRVATGEPRLWRRVDLADCCFDPTTNMEAMARAAVDRAAGCLEHFAADRFATSKLLRYIAKRTNCLKSLHLLTCMDFWYNDLVILGKRNPNLEELELTGCLPVRSILKIPMEAIGRAFPHLKRLRLNNRWLNIELDEFLDNYQALGISNSMPELRSLQLFANRLHNNVLYDILDKCPHLESLDIHQCFNIEVDAALKAKCSRLKGVKFPKDSTKDYEYETFVESTMPGSLTFQIDPPPPLPNYEYPSSDEDGECDDEDCEDDVEDNEKDDEDCCWLYDAITISTGG
uniref:F-box domain-containing protein n=1 Tax=Setaria viridis TaxID=4556 RepID=A0A4U6W837_SETVI|nr:hypothetical protein SEVIR_1G141200v2 [Setaria viridis]